MFKLLLVISNLLFSASSFAKFDFAESCNYPCLSIPAMSNSYVEFGKAETTTLPSQNLNFLVWNLYKGKKETFEADLKYISQDKQILILEEVLLTKEMSDVLKSLNGYIYSDAVSFIHKTNAASGVATGSKAMYLTEQMFRTVDKEPLIDTPKTIMANTYALDDGQKLLVLNIHGINVAGAEPLKRQLEQTEKLISSHIGPVIFAGDFNTHIEEKKVATNEFFKKLGMSHAVLKNDNRASNKTFDHIYYRNLIMNNAELITNLTGSDHPAIIATVSTH